MSKTQVGWTKQWVFSSMVFPTLRNEERHTVVVIFYFLFFILSLFYLLPKENQECIPKKGSKPLLLKSYLEPCWPCVKDAFHTNKICHPFGNFSKEFFFSRQNALLVPTP